MKAHTLAVEQVRAKGVKALTQALGPAGMVQFMQQLRPGRGDYTKERHKLLAHLTLDQIFAGIQAQRRSR
jgi:hypothetical protein